MISALIFTNTSLGHRTKMPNAYIHEQTLWKKKMLLTVIATEEKKSVQIALQKFRISGL